MEESNRWLRLITVGLVLSALAVGYFLLSGRLTSNSFVKTKSQESKTVPSAFPEAVEVNSSPAPSVLGLNSTPSPLPSNTSAYTRIVNRTQGGVQTLPRTGFPITLAVIFSASAMISGWGLKKFPH